MKNKFYSRRTIGIARKAAQELARIYEKEAAFAKNPQFIVIDTERLTDLRCKLLDSVIRDMGQ